MDLSKWLVFNALGMTFALTLALATDTLFWLPLMALSLFTRLFYRSTSTTRNAHPLTRNTYANQITALRFLLATAAALLTNLIDTRLSFFLFGTAIAMDGLDGYLARKFNQASDLGSLFDMTTDAYLVLILSFLLVKYYEVPYLILGIGYLHYGYTLLLYTLNWQQLVIPKNPIGKYVAAFLFISLLSPFILPSSFYLPILYGSSSLTASSFILSFWYKYKASVISTP